jgi:hypothetical protein
MKIDTLKHVRLVGKIISHLNEEPSDVDTSSHWVLAAIGGLLFLAIWVSQFVQ